ncbi:MAG TPA: SGNH/GDSL hydrolase family protein, partial [Myxococcota bacterium]|nr:SGNH/GDSL hydrolase family protein [Myxococcota bacterium]
GDSLSDDGNSYSIDGSAFPASPPYEKWWSNGPVAVNVLASNLGIPLGPSATGGRDYAVAGATTGTSNILTAGGIGAFANTGMQNQVNSFTGAPPAFNPATSLFVLWGGGNDLVLSPTSQAVTQAVSNLSAEVTQLAAAGARNFLIPNWLDWSLSPSAIALGPAAQAYTHSLVLLFNSDLATALGTLRGQLPTSNLMSFDTYDALNTVISNPATYGLTNVTSPCVILNTPFGGPITIASLCTNPSQYSWWDAEHPTATVHEVLGTDMVAAVPEPSTLSLALLGLLTLKATRKARRHGG